MAWESANRTESTSPGGVKPRSRRRFSDQEKLRILDAPDDAPDDATDGATDDATAPGALGLLLRTEGIYSSHLASWRRWRRCQFPQHAQSKKPPTESQRRHELKRLERENARLRLKLEHAEKLLALQRRLADLLEATADTPSNSAGGGGSWE